MTFQVGQLVVVTNTITNQKFGAEVSAVNAGTGLFHLDGIDFPFNLRTATSAGNKFLVTAQ